MMTETELNREHHLDRLAHLSIEYDKEFKTYQENYPSLDEQRLRTLLLPKKTT
jgi:hypothetical protein